MLEEPPPTPEEPPPTPEPPLPLMFCMHEPATHEAVTPHTAQAAPREPQADDEPVVWHRPELSQQPVGQVVAEHLLAVPHAVKVSDRKPDVRATVSSREERMGRALKWFPARAQPTAQTICVGRRQRDGGGDCGPGTKPGCGPFASMVGAFGSTTTFASPSSLSSKRASALSFSRSAR